MFTELWLERRREQGRKQGQDEMLRALKRVTRDEDLEQINRYIEEAKELLENLDNRRD